MTLADTLAATTLLFLDTAPVIHRISLQAAALRVQHNLSLLDALQAAVALAAGCDAFLTNDPALRRVSSLRVLVLDDFVS